MSDKDPFEIPQQWDHMPTPKELLKWMTFRPGVEYCWALVKNIAKGKREGWSTVRLHSENDGVIGNVSPIQVIDLDIILLCRGKPILGASTAAASVVWKIDPDLQAELDKLKPAVEPLVSIVPPKQNNQQGQRANAR